MDAAEARELFERKLPTIDSLIGSVCRRYGLDGDDADSFASYARFAILDDDCAVLRKFSGRGTLEGYLSVVVAHCYRDHRIKKWGRWRPSAAARRMGREAVLLDTYLNRDGHSLEEAIQRVLTRDDTTGSEKELRGMAAELPRRSRRTFQPLREVRGLRHSAETDRRVLETERTEAMDQVQALLETALDELPEEDQVILKLKFWEGLTIASISRTLGLEQKPLYRRVEANLRRLRERLQTEGVEGDQVTEWIGVRS